ncbi:MAG: hypothetical protein ABIV21_09510 [Pyrinomonadaceae bacterium]
MMACNAAQTDETATIDPYNRDNGLTQGMPGQDDYWARDNFDLPRVGTMLEDSDDIEDFERDLNTRDGINNLDLNGDGYADYISVEQFGDNYDNERGLSLFSRFGPNMIQEIATIIFDRNGNNSPGARVLLRGNEQIYGDNYYYQTDWRDRNLGIVTSLFDNRDMYRSPYYYDNYPSYYDPYQVVQPTTYVSRIQQLYPTPVFIQAAAPAFQKIKIKSPYEDKWMDKVYAKLAKPTKEQKEFAKNNPHKPEFDKMKGGKHNEPASSNPYTATDVDKGKQGKPDKAEKEAMKSAKAPKFEKLGPPQMSQDAKPGKPAKAEKQDSKPAKQQGGGNGKGKK